MLVSKMKFLAGGGGGGGKKYFDSSELGRAPTIFVNRLTALLIREPVGSATRPPKPMHSPRALKAKLGDAGHDLLCPAFASKEEIAKPLRLRQAKFTRPFQSRPAALPRPAKPANIGKAWKGGSPLFFHWPA